jgi:hypothetical protein
MARMGEKRTHTKFLSESMQGRDDTEDRNVDATVILEWKFKIKLSPWLAKHHAMKAYWGIEV